MKKNLKYFEDELSRLSKEFTEFKKKHIGKPEIGKAIELAGMEWLILDKTEKGYFAILNGFDGKERTFDSASNNWISSKLRNELNTCFLKKLRTSLEKMQLLSLIEICFLWMARQNTDIVKIRFRC